MENKKDSQNPEPLQRLKYEIAQEMGILKKSKTHENEKDIKK